MKDGGVTLSNSNSGDQEEDFVEHSLSYTLTLNEVEAKYFVERARD